MCFSRDVSHWRTTHQSTAAPDVRNLAAILHAPVTSTNIAGAGAGAGAVDTSHAPCQLNKHAPISAAMYSRMVIIHYARDRIAAYSVLSVDCHNRLSRLIGVTTMLLNSILVVRGSRRQFSLVKLKINATLFQNSRQQMLPSVCQYSHVDKCHERVLCWGLNIPINFSAEICRLVNKWQRFFESPDFYGSKIFRVQIWRFCGPETSS